MIFVRSKITSYINNLAFYALYRYVMFYLITSSVEAMKSILNSSMNAHIPLGNFVTYSTTKGAHIALAKSTAVHCAGQGLKVRCNVIHPGVVETDMIKGVIAGAPDADAARAMFEGMAPMKRMAHVDEIAGLVVYLGSDEAAFISGASYNIDGATTAGMMGV